MFQSFVNHTMVDGGGGFTSVGDVRAVPPPHRDNMESFWLAETLKYFYLLFGPDDLLPLDRVVLNTEAHPLPRFDASRMRFKTGWERVPGTRRGISYMFRLAKAAGSPSIMGTSWYLASICIV